MKKVLLPALILAVAAPAAAVELRLSESLGVAHLLGEEKSDLYSPGFMVSNSVIFDFGDHWSLDVNYFGTARISAKAWAMKKEALAIEQKRVDAEIDALGGFNADTRLTEANFTRFLTFSSYVFWGGASAIYRFGNPDGLQYHVGLGAGWFSVPRVGYDYQLRKTVNYQVEGDEGVEDQVYVYHSALSNNTETVRERSGPAIKASAGVDWAAKGILGLRATLQLLQGFQSDAEVTHLGFSLGATLDLP